MIKHSESTHWYAKDGTPCYEQPYADKKRKGEMRPTTLRDAKKLDLVPSVTVICNQLAKPQLEVWKLNQVLLSAYTCPLSRNDVSSEEWIGKVQTDAQEQARVAREKGIVIHGDIERFIQGESVNGENLERCLKVLNILELYGVHLEIETEKSFATDKYGGKIDILAMGKKLISDIKTTEFTIKDGETWKNGKKQKLHYPEHILQLTGYAIPTLRGEVNDILNIYVSTIDDSVHVHRWSIDDYYNAMRQFEALVDLWWLRNMPER